MPDDYEIISHKEVEELKQQVELLKKAAISGSTQDLTIKMRDLTQSIDSFRELLETICDEMKIEEKTPQPGLDSIQEKINTLLDENKQIAGGIIALSDMINVIQSKLENLKPAPAPAPAKPVPKLPSRGFELNPPSFSPPSFDPPEIGFNPPPLNPPGRIPLPSPPKRKFAF